MLDKYKLRMSALGSYDGEHKRRSSQKIMDASWMRDPATKPVYVKWVDSGLPVVDDNDPVLYAKFNVKSYHNITGDEIAYLLQFRQDDIRNNPNIKVGSYVQIMNEMYEPEWWLIWHLDDRNQFRQYSILKCTHIYRWVSSTNGKRAIHESLGCPRNQNSYNSGVWLDYTTQVVENQHIMVIPTNDDAKTVSYDTKFLISDQGRYPPLAWKVSKVAPSLSGDITKFTMTQEQFDPVRDNAELMIANYSDDLEQLAQVANETGNDFEIVCSGAPAVRAGGGYKKFSFKEVVDGVAIDVSYDVEWTVVFDGHDECIECQKYGNTVKLKCTNDYSLIGQTFTLAANSERGSKSIIVEVISL